MIISTRRVLGGLTAMAVLAASSCGKADSAPPVATVSIKLSKSKVAVGGLLDLTYRFQVAPDAKIAGDYRVFVHLTREDGTTIWTDDHELADSIRTSKWQPGQVIEYTRTRFLPRFSYLGPAGIEMGLYKDDERLPLAGPDPADRESPARSYKVATLELEPQSETTQVFYLSGWHPTEYSADDPTVDWQWTQKVATLSVKNPKGDVTLFLEFDARPDLFGAKPQLVTVFCGNTAIGSVPASTPNANLHRFPVPAALLGAGDMVEFRIEVDQTFVPAKLSNSTDLRELGIRVHHVHVEPK